MEKFYLFSWEGPNDQGGGYNGRGMFEVNRDWLFVIFDDETMIDRMQEQDDDFNRIELLGPESTHRFLLAKPKIQFRHSDTISFKIK